MKVVRGIGPHRGIVHRNRSRQYVAQSFPVVQEVKRFPACGLGQILPVLRRRHRPSLGTGALRTLSETASRDTAGSVVPRIEAPDDIVKSLRIVLREAQDFLTVSGISEILGEPLRAADTAELIGLPVPDVSV